MEKTADKKRACPMGQRDTENPRRHDLGVPPIFGRAPHPKQDKRLHYVDDTMEERGLPVAIHRQGNAARSSAQGRRRKASVDDYHIIKVIGKGCMGKVLLVRHKKTSQLYALKSISKSSVIVHKELSHTLAERNILSTIAQIRHPFLIQCHTAFTSRTELFLILDFVSGGDFATQLAKFGRFSRERVLFYTSEIVLGLVELHRLGVVYRDLKPENILLNPDGHIVLTDFGLSKMFRKEKMTGDIQSRHSKNYENYDDEDGIEESDDETHGRYRTNTFAGTAEYLAPEILQNKEYSFEVDWWSFGTLMYEMQAGVTPFWADNHAAMYKRVLEDPLEFPDDMPADAVDLLTGLLERNAQRRLGYGPTGSTDIKCHQYYQEVNWDDVYHKRLPVPYAPKIKSPMDLSNFEDCFTQMSPRLSPPTHDLSASLQDYFVGYSWAPNAPIASLSNQQLSMCQNPLLHQQTWSGKIINSPNDCDMILMNETNHINDGHDDEEVNMTSMVEREDEDEEVSLSLADTMEGVMSPDTFGRTSSANSIHVSLASSPQHTQTSTNTISINAPLPSGNLIHQQEDDGNGIDIDIDIDLTPSPTSSCTSNRSATHAATNHINTTTNNNNNGASNPYLTLTFNNRNKQRTNTASPGPGQMPNNAVLTPAQTPISGTLTPTLSTVANSINGSIASPIPSYAIGAAPMYNNSTLDDFYHLDNTVTPPAIWPQGLTSYPYKHDVPPFSPLSHPLTPVHGCNSLSSSLFYAPSISNKSNMDASLTSTVPTSLSPMSKSKQSYAHAAAFGHANVSTLINNDTQPCGNSRDNWSGKGCTYWQLFSKQQPTSPSTLSRQ